ncbi:MAG: FimV/HubP family polar landmark protein [Methylotenera sp.]
MHNSKLKRITVALCMALVPISVFAAGLGKLNVMSGLGEPLKADIELISVTPAELNSITATIASEEAYAVQGLEKPASHNTIKVDIAKNASGAPILKLKSTQPISEPFLDMLIQVDWASGRLLREYTVLLDPPGYTGESDSSAQDTQTARLPQIKSNDSTQGSLTQDSQMPGETMATSPSSSKKTNKSASKVKPAEDIAASDASGQEYVTQRGDTLAKIARDMGLEGISLEQMLVGLYQTNPNAFQGGNMNRLKVGQIIRQPSEETLNSISRKEASREIKVQTANWNAYRNKLAGIVANAAPTDAEANTQSAGGKIKSAAEDKSMSAATGPKDVVKLSAGDASAAKASAENIKSLEDKITALQEEATAREKSVKEAQDRTAALEKQIADMQKLLALKNGAMSDLQKQAEAAEKPQDKPAEVALPAEQAKPVEQEKPVEQAKPEATVTVDTEKPTTKPVVKPEPAAEPAAEQSFLDGILGGLGSSTLLPMGGLLALLGGGWMYLRKKRERSLADFEQGIMTSGGLKANTVFGNTASASVNTGDTSFLTDFSQSANGGMIDTNDVDPIAEAEVYMAYGRDAQAEEILKDAISKEPKRYELHLKLLEMYAASKNVSAFETISGELYTTLGAEDPTWAKVAEIGIKLEPNNPLYQANSSPSGASSKPADASDKLDATDFSDSPLAAEKDLDFSFDNESLAQNYASPDAPVGDVPDLDLGKLGTEGKETAEVAKQAMPDSDGGMDLDLGDLGSAKLNSLAEESAQAVATEFGHTMPSLDIDAFDVSKFMPEAATEQAEPLPELDEIKLEGFESLQQEVATQEAGVLDLSGAGIQFPVAEDKNEGDFNFELNTISPEASSFKDGDLAEANAFDLSTINLDLSDSPDIGTSAKSSSDKPAELSLSGHEPIEVETKLDLVVAYIEMDDKEGAKELLDEVLKEGGTNQRKRAEALLAKLA